MRSCGRGARVFASGARVLASGARVFASGALGVAGLPLFAAIALAIVGAAGCSSVSSWPKRVTPSRGAAAEASGVVRHSLRTEGSGPRLLCVVAHPDDEVAFAATVFKTVSFLDGTCDILVITNGEAGYKYSTLGALHYGLDLTDPDVGRRLLPGIRQREHLAGGRLLGFRRVTYLNQQDHRYTLDPEEVLSAAPAVPGVKPIWDVELVSNEIERALDEGAYDFVFTHLPSVKTHGHHQAATLLALRAVQAMDVESRPVVLGAFPSSRRGEVPAPSPRSAEYPESKVRPTAAPLRFDRSQKFGFRERLDYQIVVNWVIAEHKSQGSFQTLAGRWDLENFYIFDVSRADAESRARVFMDALAKPQFDVPNYDADGRALEAEAGERR